MPPTPDSQTQLLLGDPRLQKLYVMTIKRFKHLTHKPQKKTENESKTNGKSKVNKQKQKQQLTYTNTYAHTYIHILKRNQNIAKKTVQECDQRNNETENKIN